MFLQHSKEIIVPINQYQHNNQQLQQQVHKDSKKCAIGPVQMNNKV